MRQRAHNHVSESARARLYGLCVNGHHSHLRAIAGGQSRCDALSISSAPCHFHAHASISYGAVDWREAGLEAHGLAFQDSTEGKCRASHCVCAALLAVCDVLRIVYRALQRVDC